MPLIPVETSSSPVDLSEAVISDPLTESRKEVYVSASLVAACLDTGESVFGDSPVAGAFQAEASVLSRFLHESTELIQRQFEVGVVELSELYNHLKGIEEALSDVLAIEASVDSDSSLEEMASQMEEAAANQLRPALGRYLGHEKALSDIYGLRDTVECEREELLDVLISERA